MFSMLIFFFSMLFLIKFLNKNLIMYWFQNLMFIFFFFLFNYLLNLNYLNNWMFIYMDFGMDKISLFLVLLLIWISGLMFMTMMMINKMYSILLTFEMVIMIVSLLMFFFSMNLMKFYIFFELSLIPIFLMVLGWGTQPERLQAGIYMMMYTMFFSFPFLLIIIMMKLNLFTYNMMFIINFILMKGKLNFFYYMMMMMVFMVKLPIYMIHLWLPKAHVEAPIFGSMLLAGVMLKMGGYGILRYLFMYMNLMLKYNIYFIIFILIGSLNISIICLQQIDLKMLIAYSSVVHMGFMMVAMLMNYNFSIMGGLLMMISHGICSSGLFCLLNFSYKRINSRLLMFNKGLINLFSNMSMMWFIFCVMNFGAPPSLNLVSEIMLLICMLKFSMKMVYLIFFLMLFSMIYSIYLYSYSQHGFNYFMKFSNNFNLVDEYLLMILHLIPMNIFILNLSLFIF